MKASFPKSYFEHVGNGLYVDIGSPYRDAGDGRLYKEKEGNYVVLPYKYVTTIEVTVGHPILDWYESRLKLVIVEGKKGMGILGKKGNLILPAEYSKIKPSLSIDFARETPPPLEHGEIFKPQCNAHLNIELFEENHPLRTGEKR